MRLSAYLARRYGISRKYAGQLIRGGRVSIGGRPVRSDIVVEAGCDYAAEIPSAAIAYNIEDYHILPAGDAVFFYKPVLMHSERLTPSDPLCLDDIVSREYSGYRLISRLDYGVDGVIAALKANVPLSAQEKTYLAWVRGVFPETETGRWLVDAAQRRKVKALRADNGVLMRFRRLEISESLSLIEITLEKAGRHQVRAVCAALGYPIAGDHLYGGGNGAADRIFLHCSKVSVNGIAGISPLAGQFMGLY